MDVTRTEEEQIEALKKWWAENGWALIIGVVIGLGAIFGWRGWQTHQALQSEAASDIYVQIVSDVRKQRYETARTHAEKLMQEYGSTSYALFASLMLAKLDAEAGNIESAINHLQWVINETDETALEHLARIRMGRLLLAEDKPEAALSLVEKIETQQFVVSYQELMGDIYTRLGRTADAHNAYQLALAAIGNNVNEDSLLQLKFDASKQQD